MSLKKRESNIIKNGMNDLPQSKIFRLHLTEKLLGMTLQEFVINFHNYIKCIVMQDCFEKSNLSHALC